MAVLAAGCKIVDSGSVAPIERNAKWVMLPVLNHTEVPQAGLRAEAITEALLRSSGVNDLTRYPAVLNAETLFEPAERKVMAEAEKWARSQRARMALQGRDRRRARGRRRAAHHGPRDQCGRVDRCRRKKRLEPRIALRGRAKAHQGAARHGPGALNGADSALG